MRVRTLAFIEPCTPRRSKSAIQRNSESQALQICAFYSPFLGNDERWRDVSPINQTAGINAVLFCSEPHRCLPYFGRSISFLLLLGIALSGNAQSIRIKLVNGKSGRPVANTCVNVWVGTERKEAMAIPTDKEGVARLRLTDKDGEINIQSQWKNCGTFGLLNPVVRYSDTIGINASYAMCETGGSNYSWLAVLRYAMAKVLRDGIVSSNTCGKANATAEPGEIILFVRPLTWWEKFKT